MLQPDATAGEGSSATTTAPDPSSPLWQRPDPLGQRIALTLATCTLIMVLPFGPQRLWLALLVGVVQAVSTALVRRQGLSVTEEIARYLTVELDDLGQSADSAALLLLDLDNFKEINDSLGHDVGDRVLCEVATRLTSIDPRVLVVRLGGDEFAIVVSGDLQRAAAFADDVQSCLRPAMELGDMTLSIRASIGMAHTDVVAARSLLRFADIAMYRAKRDGRGPTWYQADDDPHSERRLALMQDLSEALEVGQVQPWFQPQVDVITGVVVGGELLATRRVACWTRGTVESGCEVVEQRAEQGLFVNRSGVVAHRFSQRRVPIGWTRHSSQLDRGSRQTIQIVSSAEAPRSSIDLSHHDAGNRHAADIEVGVNRKYGACCAQLGEERSGHGPRHAFGANERCTRVAELVGRNCHDCRVLADANRLPGDIGERETIAQHAPGDSQRFATRRSKERTVEARHVERQRRRVDHVDFDAEAGPALPLVVDTADEPHCICHENAGRCLRIEMMRVAEQPGGQDRKRQFVDRVEVQPIQGGERIEQWFRGIVEPESSDAAARAQRRQPLGNLRVVHGGGA